MEISGSASSYSLQGMKTGFDSLTTASAKIANPNQLDKSKPLIDTKQSANQVEASAKSFKAADDRIGTLLDIMA